MEEVSDRLARATVSAFEEAEHLTIEHLKRTGQAAEAAKHELMLIESTPIDLSKFLSSKEIDEKMNQLTKEMRDKLSSTFSQIIPYNLHSTTDQLRDDIRKTEEEMKRLGDLAKATESASAGHGGGAAVAMLDRQIRQQEALKTIYSGLLQHLDQVTDVYMGKKTAQHDDDVVAHVEKVRRDAEEQIAILQAQGPLAASAERAIWQKVVEAARAGGELTRSAYIEALSHIRSDLKRGLHDAEEVVAQHDKAAMTQLELAAAQQGVVGQRLLQQKVTLLASEVAAEQQYPTRVEAITAEIVRIMEESHSKATEADRKLLEMAKHNTEQLVEEYRRRTEAERKAFEDSLRMKQEQLREANEEDRGRLLAGTDANVGNFQLQKSHTERSYSLGGDFSPSAQAAELAQLRDFDKKIIEEKLSTAKILAEADSINDPKRYAQDLQEIARLQAQEDQQQYQETTRSLQLQRQQYQNYFNEITGGFTHAIDDMLVKGRGFTADMQHMWGNLATTFVNSWVKMGLMVGEQELYMTAAHIAGNEARVSSDKSASAQSAMLRMTDTLKQVTADAVKAASGAYAATVDIPIIGPALAPVAASGAFLAVEALGSIAAFETGGYTPKGGLAILHPNETIVNSPLTNALNTIVNNGGMSGGNTNSFHVNQTNNYHGIMDSNSTSAANRSANRAYGALSSKMRRMGMRY